MIVVVCSKCRRRFQVSDQFAGRTGPCPHCKAPIKIPTPEEEVKIHGPEPTPPGKSGRNPLILKPIARTETEFRPKAALLIAGLGVAVFCAAYLGGRTELIPGSAAIQLFVLLLVSPPLVAGGYAFLNEDELEPYRGKTLYLRVGIASLSYVVLWLLFGMGVVRVLGTDEIWGWVIAIAPFVVAGGLIALGALDLEFGNAMLLYSFYLLVTVLLARTAGLPWVWFKSSI